MKRYVALILVIGLCCGLLGCRGSGNKDFKFKLNESKKSYSLVEYRGNGEYVMIPSEYKGKPVTAIGDAFQDNLNVEEVVIPDSVTYIGEGAFRNCENLSEVEIPDSVTAIGDYAFACSGLEELVIPEGAEIGWYAFTGCEDLAYVELGTEGDADSEYAINRGAFEDCDDLIEARVGPAYGEVGWNAFCDCEKLSAIYVPGNLEAFGMNSLYVCPNLTDIYFDGTQSDWDKVEIDEYWGGDSATVHFMGE